MSWTKKTNRAGVLMTSTVIAVLQSKCSLYHFPSTKHLASRFSITQTLKHVDNVHLVGALFSPFLCMHLLSFPPVIHYFSKPPWWTNSTRCTDWFFSFQNWSENSLTVEPYLNERVFWIAAEHRHQFILHSAYCKITPIALLERPTLLPLNIQSVYLKINMNGMKFKRHIWFLFKNK